MISAWWLIPVFVIGQLTAFLTVAFFEGIREKGGGDEDE